MAVDILTLQREAKLIRSGLPLNELVERSKLVDRLNKQFGEVKNDIKKFERTANTAASEAKKATQNVNRYQREFNKVKQQVGRDLRRLGDDINKKTKPLQDAYKKVDRGVQRLTKGLDKFASAAGIGFGLAGVVISFMALWASEANQAAFDRQVNAFQVLASKELGLMQQLKSRIDKTNKRTDVLEREADLASDAIKQNRSIADRAYKLANDITYEARVKIRKLNDIVAQANSNASKAFIQNTSLKNDVKQTQSSLKTIEVKVQKVDVKAVKAESEALQARSGVKLVDSKATTALATAQQIPAKIPIAVNNAIAPVKAQVQQAQQAAQQAKAENPPQNQRITELENKVRAIQVKPATNTPTPNSPTTNNPTINQADVNRAVNNSIAGMGILPRLTAAQVTADAALKQSTAALNKPELEPIGRNALGLGANNSAAIDRLNQDIQQLKAPNLLEPRVTGVETKLREREKMDAAANQKLDQLVADRSKLDLMLTGLGGLALMAPSIINNLGPKIDGLPDKTASAVAAAPCNGRGCGGRTAQRVDDLAGEMGALRNQVNGLPNTVANVVNSGANAVQIPLLNTINNKLGAPVPGGIGGLLQKFSNSFEKFAEWAHLDRILNVLTFTATVHNAYMLSNALTQTFFSMISNVLAAIGIKDKDNNPLDINTIVGQSIENLLKGMLGASTVDGMKAEWKKYSRIYQAAANIINSLQSIGYSILGAMEVLGNWIASIGNALKAWGVVWERAYRWMNPQVDFQNPYFTAINNLENVVSNIDQVAQEVLSIQDTVGQLGKQKAELGKAVAEADGSRQTAGVSEAEKVAAAAMSAKSASIGPSVTSADTVKPES